MDAPYLRLSRRWMLNRLSFEPQNIHDLVNRETGQTMPSALACLLDLESLGFAQRSDGKGWRITDAGVVAVAERGVIYSE